MVTHIILQMLEDKILDKKSYFDVLKNGDIEIGNMLSEKGYDYSKVQTHELFHLSTDERLEMARKKKEAVAENPSIALCEFIQGQANILDKFLGKYHIGWMNDFYVNERGFVDVSISCLIHPSFSDDNLITKKIVFKNQMNTLKSLGLSIVLSKSENEANLINCDKNQKIIRELLSEKGAKLIKFTVGEKNIRDVEFTVNITDVSNFEEDTISIVPDITDTLNQDEECKLKNLCKDLNFATVSLSGNLLNTCGSLVESYYGEICEILNFDGVIRQTVKSRHLESRNKNNEIREIENSIGSIFPEETARDTVELIYNNLSGAVINQLGFNCFDFKIDRYGSLSARLVYQQSSHHFGKGKLISEEDLINKFSFVGISRRNESLFIIDDKGNREEILKTLNSINPSTRILNFKIEERGLFVIKDINIIIQDIVSLFSKTYEENTDEE